MFLYQYSKPQKFKTTTLETKGMSPTKHTKKSFPCSNQIKQALTHCGLVMPYDDTELDQQSLR